MGRSSNLRTLTGGSSSCKLNSYPQVTHKFHHELWVQSTSMPISCTCPATSIAYYYTPTLSTNTYSLLSESVLLNVGHYRAAAGSQQRCQSSSLCWSWKTVSLDNYSSHSTNCSDITLDEDSSSLCYNANGKGSNLRNVHQQMDLHLAN